MLRERALELLRRTSEHGVPLENHCRRLAEFAAALAAREGIATDPDLLAAATYLHDFGLLVRDPAERNYLRRGQRHVAERTAGWGLDAAQRKVLDDVMLYSHSLQAVPGISPQGELVRRAVGVEHSLGRLTHGLDRATCKEIFARIPRDGLNRVLLAFFRTAIVDDGPTELLRIFFPLGGLHAPL